MSGALRLTDVAGSFPTRDGGRLSALDGVDLDVPEGQLVACIGPNGSGKSTLLRVIAGLLAPDRGAVELDGALVTRPDPRIGLVFQEPRLLPWRTGGENITYPLELAGSGSRWPAPSRWNPRSCCSTSRSAPSMRSPASDSISNCCASASWPGPR
jgi:ABC-type nitrate/sulfonate/bicarbonate transport system ATPase subunit